MIRVNRRLPTAVCAITMALVAIGVAAADQEIRFKRGATSAKITGYLSGSQEVCYSLKARSGQHMKVDADGKGAIVGEITMPDGRKEGQPGGPFFDSDLTETGDYRVCLSESPRGDRWKGQFTLTVEIR
jgi:hypothetical protein